MLARARTSLAAAAAAAGPPGFPVGEDADGMDDPEPFEPAEEDPGEHLEPANVPPAPRGSTRKVTVEDVEDEGDAPSSSHVHRERFSEPYPDPAGVPLSFEKSPTSFEEFRASKPAEYGPFDDEDDWELGKFLMQNLGVNKTGEFLKLGKVRICYFIQIVPYSHSVGCSLR